MVTPLCQLLFNYGSRNDLDKAKAEKRETNIQYSGQNMSVETNDTLRQPMVYVTGIIGNTQQKPIYVKETWKVWCNRFEEIANRQRTSLIS